MADRKKPGWVFWTTVLVGVPVLYALSIPLINWCAVTGRVPFSPAVSYFVPFNLICVHSSEGIHTRMREYAYFLTPRLLEPLESPSAMNRTSALHYGGTSDLFFPDDPQNPDDPENWRGEW